MLAGLFLSAMLPLSLIPRLRLPVQFDLVLTRLPVSTVMCGARLLVGASHQHTQPDALQDNAPGQTTGTLQHVPACVERIS